MLLGPGKDVLVRRAESVQVGNVQAPRHVPARDAAELTVAPGSLEAVAFTQNRQRRGG
jgi:hypothetical protein